MKREALTLNYKQLVLLQGVTMKKTSILITLVVLMAMIPLTYVIGRGGGHHGGGHGGHRHGGYHHGGYHRGGYWGYNNAAWAVPLAVGTAAAIGSAAAASSDTSYDDSTYYPDDRADTEYVEEPVAVVK